ncbi:hypothetical protein R5R35_000947 [Gryllus longicercus]|uniref:Uncharacterized protein n=1 Tax=Gryllus longicercus TaxID=2509291 RepID=A0AAN9V6I8_9ORTH
MPQDPRRNGQRGVPFVYVFQEGIGMWNNGAVMLVPSHVRHLQRPQYFLRFGTGRFLMWQAEALAGVLFFPAVFTELWSQTGTVTAFLCSWLFSSFVYSVVFNPCSLLTILHENRLVLKSYDDEITQLYDGKPPLRACLKVRSYIRMLDISAWLIVFLMTFSTVFTVNGVMSVFWGNVLKYSIRTSLSYSICLVSLLPWMSGNVRRFELFPEAISIYSIFLSVITPMVFRLESNTDEVSEHYPFVDLMVSLGSIVVLTIRFLAVTYDAAEEYLAHDFGDKVRALLRLTPEDWHYYVTMAIMFGYRLSNQ